jgi:hypothetical protein
VSTMFGTWTSYGGVSHYVLTGTPLCGDTGEKRGNMVRIPKYTGPFTPPLCKDCIWINTKRWRTGRDTRTSTKPGPDAGDDAGCGTSSGGCG